MKKFGIATLLVTSLITVNLGSPARAETLDEYAALAASTQAGYVLVADDGTVIIPEDSPSDYVSNPRLRLIDFWQWSNCFTFNNSTFRIKTYQTFPTSFYNGSIDLQCGTDTTHGYRHIALNANCLPIAVKTIISTNNRRIITAYPASSTC